MAKYVLSTKAHSDLIEIWNYTAETWSVDQAHRYDILIQSHIEQISKKPEIGRKCPQIFRGCQKVTAGSHIIFYSVGEDDLIYIDRILHKRMDIESHFKDF